MKPRVDWSLYLVACPELCAGRPLPEVVRAAVRGGVTAVQLRCKQTPTREFLRLAEALRGVLGAHGVALIINDRADVALAAGADGLHVGQGDMPVAAARRILGPDAVIGLSADTLDQALSPEAGDADYLGVGPIFPTATKADTQPPWGCGGLRELRRRTRRVLIGIGGITADNAGDVIRAGADGIAVVSAVCAAEDPQAAAERLRAAVADARRGRV